MQHGVHTNVMSKMDDAFEQELALHRQSKAVERSNAGKVLRKFAKQLAPEFSRKGTFFSRERGHLIQFLHVHKFSFGPCFRVHACLRVLNDSTSRLVLNGISSDDDAHYRMSIEYGSDEASLSKCADEMTAYVSRIAKPWFLAQTYSALLGANSALYPDQRLALSAALRGDSDESRVALSRSLLAARTNR